MELMFEVLPLKRDLLQSKPQFLHINQIIDIIFGKFYIIWSVREGNQSLICDIELIYISFKSAMNSTFISKNLCGKPQILTNNHIC